MKQIIDRINTEETKLGKFVKNWIGKVLLLCTGIGALTEYMAVVPHDFVPEKIKALIFISGAIAFVVGKLTAKKTDKP